MLALRNRLNPCVATRLAPLAVRSVHVEAKLKELDITLPEMPRPLASYVTCTRMGNVIFTAGHVPFEKDMKALIKAGKVGKDYSVQEGHDIARWIGVELISTLKHELGDLDKVKKIVKVVGFVNCPDDFAEQPEVLNGCSNLMQEVFGAKGVHARSAVGTNSLPRQMPVEIEMIVEVED